MRGSARLSLFEGQHTLPWSAKASSVRVYLVANRTLSIAVDYQHTQFDSGLTLSWELPNAYTEVIPAQNLYWYNGTASCACPEECNSHGRGPQACLPTGTCLCDANYVGAACESYACQMDDCVGTDLCNNASLGSGHSSCQGVGVCDNGVCMCPPG